MPQVARFYPGATKGWRRMATHCQHGHEFTPENTYTRAEGWRQCRACNREAVRGGKRANDA